MPLPSIQDLVSALLTRQQVEDKTRGTPSAELEAAAVIETVALNLTFQPKAALYLAHLARNSLLSLMGEELSTVAAVRADIQDLGNQSFSITDLSALQRARTALLQVESQGQFSSGGAFKSFQTAVDSFLSQQLSKNVRRNGSTSLVRPKVEAAQALPDDVASLKDLHTQTVSRLGYLVESVRNFSFSLATGKIGLNVAYRARQDIEDMLAALENDPQAAGSREYALRLLAAKAALRGVGSAPDPLALRIDRKNGLPYGYSLRARTAPVYCSITDLGPFLYQAGATMGLNGTVVQFPMTSIDLGTRPLIAGGALPASFTVPANTHLYLKFEANQVRIPLNATNDDTTMTLSDVISAINSSAGSFCDAVEYIAPGSSRLAIVSKMRDVGILLGLTEPSPDSTVDIPVVFTKSAHELLGFAANAYAADGYRSTELVAGAINASFGSQVTATFTATTVTITALSADTPLDFDGAPVGTVRVSPASSEIVLFGTITGATQDPISAKGLVEPGDVLTTQAGDKATITDTGITLDQPVPSFEGEVLVESAIGLMWKALQASLDSFVALKGSSPFAQDLSRLDALIAPLYGSPTPARRSEALEAISMLQSWLQDLQSALRVGSLPPSIDLETSVANGIIATLQERKFDRALSFLLQGRIAEVLTMDWQTASFGGELMSSLSDVAQKDSVWPKASKDQGYGAVGSSVGSGEIP